ncbi:MAG: class I adenylate-forming enzyme family protein [Thermoleophilaceae bacterium]
MAERPSHTALMAHSQVEGGEVVLSYAELSERAALLAGALGERGVEQGDRVVILLTNAGSVEAHVAYHASHRLGAINVPLNTFYVERELRYALGFVEPAAVVFGPDLAALLSSALGPDARPTLVEVAREPVLGEALPALTEDAATAPPVPLSETADADWIFTSGTTGHPKAVALSHANSVACGYEAMHVWGLDRASVYQNSSPFFTSTGSHTNQLACLAARCTNVVDPQPSLEAIMDRAVRAGTTSLFLLTALLAMLFRRIDDGRIARLDPGLLRRLTYGGQTMPREFHERVQREFGDERGIGLGLVYGLTEGGTCGLLLDPEDHREAVRRHGPYGMPIGTRGWNDWVDWRIVGEDGAHAAPGEVGEIRLRAPSMMSRYVNDEEATARTLVKGWLHTGDMATIDEAGFVYFVDRDKQMIRRGGMNIASAEVEAVAMSHPAVAEAVALGRPNPVLGEDVHLVVVLEEDAAAGGDEIVEHCRCGLADYKVPRSVEFIDELPRNPMGKVVRGEIKTSFAEEARR